MKTNATTKFEKSLQEELLCQSRRFSNLCYYLMIINGTVATLACGLLLMGKIQEGAISVTTGFGATALVNRAGKESRQSLELLLTYLEQSR